MTRSSELIKAIVQQFPGNALLKTKLSELDGEIAQINADRNRLIRELSRARNEINRLRAGLE